MGSDRVEEQESPSALFGAIVVSLPPISLSLNILGKDERGREGRRGILALFKVGNSSRAARERRVNL